MIDLFFWERKTCRYGKCLLVGPEYDNMEDVVLKNMGSVVKGLDKAMASMDLEKVHFLLRKYHSNHR